MQLFWHWKKKCDFWLWTIERAFVDVKVVSTILKYFHWKVVIQLDWNSQFNWCQLNGWRKIMLTRHFHLAHWYFWREKETWQSTLTAKTIIFNSTILKSTLNCIEMWIIKKKDEIAFTMTNHFQLYSIKWTAFIDFCHNYICQCSFCCWSLASYSWEMNCCNT